MAETEQGATQADATQQPQAGTPTEGTQAEPTTNPQPETLSLDEAKKLRAEANSLRKRLAEYDAAQKAAEEAKLGDLEKATKRAEDASKAAETFKKALASAKLENAAIKSNALDADAVVALLSGKLEFGDDGQPTNVDDLVKELAKAKPHLFKTAAQEPQRTPVSSGGASNPGRGAPAGRPTKADVMAGRLTLEQSTELWKTGEMQKILAGN